MMNYFIHSLWSSQQALLEGQLPSATEEPAPQETEPLPPTLQPPPAEVCVCVCFARLVVISTTCVTPCPHIGSSSSLGVTGTTGTTTQPLPKLQPSQRQPPPPAELVQSSEFDMFSQSRMCMAYSTSNWTLVISCTGSLHSYPVSHSLLYMQWHTHTHTHACRHTHTSIFFCLLFSLLLYLQLATIDTIRCWRCCSSAGIWLTL